MDHVVTSFYEQIKDGATIHTEAVVSQISFDKANGLTPKYDGIITTGEWETAKAELIADGMLNKAGAITAKGKNAIGNASL